MEEEISYSTVVFKNRDEPPKEKKPEEPPVYSEVKLKGTAATVPEKKPEEPPVHSEVTPKGTAATVPEADSKEEAHPRLCALAVCLGILCVFLTGTITAVIYMSVIVDEQEANLSNLTAENQQLIMARSILQTKTDELSRINDNFNWTLNTILKYDNFPVNEYCPEKKCQPCRKNWILFQEKCYLIDLRDSPWLTWDGSRKHCQNFNADLVVIDSLEEQEFISNHSQFYYDKYHGYWIGLYKDPNESSDDQKWLWINGRNGTLKYWLQEQDIGTPGPCVMVIPKKNPSASWDTADCIMQNRFICEMDPVIWPN